MTSSTKHPPVVGGGGQAYRPDIDGLRAVAVTAVVLFHAGVPGLTGGFVGVDVFFVISGFLIGNIVYRGVRDDAFSFTSFYARRARRILPALFVVIAFTMMAGTLLLSPEELKDTARSAGSAAVGLSNVRFWLSVDYFNPQAALDPMLMTWSLGVEEQFYVICPFVLLAFRNAGHRTNFVAIATLTLVSLAASVIVTPRASSAAFYLLPTRAWELGVGILLAIRSVAGRPMPNGRSADVLGIAATCGLAGSMCLFSEATAWPGVAAVVPVLATAALIASGPGLVNKALSARPIVTVGLLSYSWYLWHWPLLALLRASVVGEPSPSAVAITVGVSLGLAYLSWRFVEQRFRKPVLTDAGALTRYGVALAGALAVSGSVVLANGLPARVPAEAVSIDAAVKGAHGYPCLVGAGARPDFGESCVRLIGGRPTVAVIGDSHAGALGPAVQTLARRHRSGSAVLTRTSCRPLLGVTVRKADQPDFEKECAEFMRRATEWAAGERSVRSVILAGLWGGPLRNPNESYVAPGTASTPGTSLLTRGLSQAVERLRRAGKIVHVVQDTPYWTFDPAQAALVHTLPLRRGINDLAATDRRVTRFSGPTRPPPPGAEAAVADGAITGGARVLRVRDALCPKGTCVYRSSVGLLYADKSHLSAAGALVALAPVVDDLFGSSRLPVSASMPR